MKIFGIVGWSNSGKTSLLVRLIPALTAAGLRVSTMKHAHHGFDVDSPGKDSYQHRAAGATEVMIASASRWALMHELRDAPEPGIEELVPHMTPVDLLLIEGFKRHAHDKLEVFRREVGKPLLAADDPRVVAVASDGPVPELDGLTPARPLIDLDDTAAIARFVIDHCGLASRPDAA
jgi:molybdopterin-guanine dinucleotide biosynthesis protein B